MRESALWAQRLRAVGCPPTGARWVVGADRGADIYEHLQQRQAQGLGFVVRAAQNRALVAGADKTPTGRPPLRAGPGPAQRLHLYPGPARTAAPAGTRGGVAGKFQPGPGPAGPAAAGRGPQGQGAGYAIIFSRCLMRLSLFTAVGTTVTTTYLEVGVLLTLATLVMGTSGLASGK